MTSDLRTRRKQYQLFIGGRWVSGSGEFIESTNPYTGEVWAEVRSASPADVQTRSRDPARAFLLASSLSIAANSVGAP